MTIISAPNQISLATIKTEFGGDASDISLFDYYAGGSFVQSGATGDGGAIPSANEITIQDFYGASAITVTVSGESISDAATRNPLTAGVRINSDGTIDKLVNTTYTQIDASTDWIIPNGSADNTYDVRVTSVTGDAFTSAAAANDAWIALSANRLWTVVNATGGAGGDKSTSFTIEIRKDSGSVLSSASYTLTTAYL